MMRAACLSCTRSNKFVTLRAFPNPYTKCKFYLFFLFSRPHFNVWRFVLVNLISNPCILYLFCFVCFCSLFFVTWSAVLQYRAWWFAHTLWHSLEIWISLPIYPVGFVYLFVCFFVIFCCTFVPRSLPRSRVAIRANFTSLFGNLKLDFLAREVKTSKSCLSVKSLKDKTIGKRDGRPSLYSNNVSSSVLYLSSVNIIPTKKKIHPQCWTTKKSQKSFFLHVTRRFYSFSIIASPI